MFRIEPDQVEALDDSAMQAYCGRVREHIDTHFPDHSAALEDAHLRALIDHAIERGGQYGVFSERDICLWVTLMLVLGVDFDESEDLPWVREILTDESSQQPHVRMDNLHARAVQEIEAREAAAAS